MKKLAIIPAILLIALPAIAGAMTISPTNLNNTIGASVSISGTPNSWNYVFYHTSNYFPAFDVTLPAGWFWSNGGVNPATLCNTDSYQADPNNLTTAGNWCIDGHILSFASGSTSTIQVDIYQLTDAQNTLCGADGDAISGAVNPEDYFLSDPNCAYTNSGSLNVGNFPPPSAPSLFSAPTSSDLFASIGDYSGGTFTNSLPLVYIAVGFFVGALIILFLIDHIRKAVRKATNKKPNFRS